MAAKAKTIEKPQRWYRGANIPLRVIRKFAREVAEHFHPEKIVLFGSYAYGTPHEDSDVDILVVMPCRNQGDMAFKIRCTIDPPFAAHVVVRTPYAMEWRLREGDSFLREVVAKGRVMYEAPDSRLGQKSRSRLPRRASASE